MPSTNISLNDALEIDLFDDVKYMYVKDLLDSAGWDDWRYIEYMEEKNFTIYYEDLPNENYCPKTNRYLKTKITFELEYNKFEKIYEYGEDSVRNHTFKKFKINK